MCCVCVHPFSLTLTSIRAFMSVLQLLSHTPMVLEFLLQQSEINFDGSVQQNERNRKILRCLLSWVQNYTDDSFGFASRCILLELHLFAGQDILCLVLLLYFNMEILLSRASSKLFYCLLILFFYDLCVQVRAGCFSEISPGMLPAHPLLNFIFNSLQVIQFSYTCFLRWSIHDYSKLIYICILCVGFFIIRSGH